MARLRTYADNNNGWLVTFADLVTLLLALFVLIFSMSSLDSAIIQSISSSINRDMPKKDLNRGKITEEIREAAQLMLDTGMVHQHEGRIKELLFPRDLLPAGIDKGTLDTSLRVEEQASGVAFVIDNSMLFAGSGSGISTVGRKILSSMARLPDAMQSDVRISAFYAGPVMRDLPDDYAAAGQYALSVLGVFVEADADLKRFSISAYGADRAGLEPVPQGVSKNRVELLFKTGKNGLTEKVEDQALSLNCF